MELAAASATAEAEDGRGISLLGQGTMPGPDKFVLLQLFIERGKSPTG